MKATCYLIQVFEKGCWGFDESHKTPLNRTKTEKYLRDLRRMGRTARIVAVSGLATVVEDQNP